MQKNLSLFSFFFFPFFFFFSFFLFFHLSRTPCKQGPSLPSLILPFLQSQHLSSKRFKIFKFRKFLFYIFFSISIIIIVSGFSFFFLTFDLRFIDREIIYKTTDLELGDLGIILHFKYKVDSIGFLFYVNIKLG